MNQIFLVVYCDDDITIVERAFATREEAEYVAAEMEEKEKRYGYFMVITREIQTVLVTKKVYKEYEIDDYETSSPRVVGCTYTFKNTGLSHLLHDSWLLTVPTEYTKEQALEKYKELKKQMEELKNGNDISGG